MLLTIDITVQALNTVVQALNSVHYIRIKSVLLLKQNDKENVLAKNKQNSVTEFLEIYTTLTYTHVTSTRNQKRNLKGNEYPK